MYVNSINPARSLTFFFFCFLGNYTFSARIRIRKKSAKNWFFNWSSNNRKFVVRRGKYIGRGTCFLALDLNGSYLIYPRQLTLRHWLPPPFLVFLPSVSRLSYYTTIILMDSLQLEDKVKYSVLTTKPSLVFFVPLMFLTALSTETIALMSVWTDLPGLISALPWLGPY